MDNRITRRRLYNFLSYEWIIMIIVAVACILAWNLIFTMTSVKITVGQDFKFFYDETIDSNTSGNIYTLFEKQDDPERTVFSYDLLKIGHETLQEQYNVLKDRMSVQEGDIIITDATEPNEDAENKGVRAKTIIDTYPTYDFISLKEDAEEYLAQFLKDGLTEDADVTDFNNLDGNKIEEVFRERMKKDNRYRSEGQKQEGIALEKERIKDLCAEVKKFGVLLEQETQQKEDGYFLWYQRYDQMFEQDLTEENKEILNADEYRKKGVRPYGLKVEALSGGEGKDSPSKYFKKIGADDAKDVVILVFDLKEYQPHLQFEAIAFINAVVSGCSNLYDGI